MTEKEWLQQLEAGDEVFIAGEFSRSPTTHTVSRTTPTRVFVRFNSVYEKPFRKSDGYAVGEGGYFRSILLMPTDSLKTTIKTTIKIQELKGKIRELWGKIVFPSTMPELEELAAFLERYVPKKEAE